MNAEIRLENVNVKFPSYKLNARRKIAQLYKNKVMEEFNVLEDINIEIKTGDRVGLVGQNGAGKTTLLRIISGILPPNSGNVRVVGNVLPLIQVRANVIPKLTCLQNIKLHGLRNKLSGNALSDYIENVKLVSSLERFMNFPVAKLSVGMRSRLVLSMLHADPADIVVMDEWIGTTDQKVLKHGEGLLSKLINSSKIFVLASHRVAILNEYCNLIIKMENGKIVSTKRTKPND